MQFSSTPRLTLHPYMLQGGRFVTFTLQSWDERRHDADDASSDQEPSPPSASLTPPWSPVRSPARSSTLSNTAVLLSPRQWRPLSPHAASDSAASAQTAQDTLEPDTQIQQLSSHQTATRKALSEFIMDTYTGVAERGEYADRPADDKGLPRATPPDQETISETQGQDAANHATRDAGPRRGSGAAETTAQVQGAATTSSTSTTSQSEGGAETTESAPDSRPGSSASSTTESLDELEEDILHMLSSGRVEEDDGPHPTPAPVPTSGEHAGGVGAPGDTSDATPTSAASASDPVPQPQQGPELTKVQADAGENQENTKQSKDQQQEKQPEQPTPETESAAEALSSADLVRRQQEQYLQQYRLGLGEPVST